MNEMLPTKQLVQLLQPKDPVPSAVNRASAEQNDECVDKTANANFQPSANSVSAIWRVKGPESRQ